MTVPQTGLQFRKEGDTFDDLGESSVVAILRGISCTHAAATIRPCAGCAERFGRKTQRCQQLACPCGLVVDLLEENG